MTARRRLTTPRWALSGSDDGTMKVIEIASGNELHSFNHGDGQVVGVGFANNSTFAVSAGGKSLKVWDLSGL
jgi:WD40 repeat protein